MGGRKQGTKLGTIRAFGGEPQGEPATSGEASRGRSRKRIRSPHPGVKLKARGASWRAHYRDPDSGREVAVTLPAEVSSREARVAWAKRLSVDLAKRRLLARPRPLGGPTEPVTIADGLARYRADAAHRLRDKTLRTYALAFAHLEAWAARERVRTTAELTPARLASLRAALVAAPKQRAAPGARRGASAATSSTRSPVSVNRELRSIATLLTSWRRSGLVTLSSDEIADGLRRLPVERELPAYLGAADLRRLLDAALRHDRETFSITRAEHDGLRPVGSTPRFAAIAPFVALVLLTGMRRGEALGLRWSDVDLDALDAAGAKVGEIRLRASATKTKTARVVGLEIAPTLRRIVAALRLRAGEGAAEERVFPALTADMLGAARDRLVQSFGAPPFTWQQLRSTCSTYLVNAPGVYGAASAFLAARQLGHSVVVAERRYAGTLRGIPREARTLEAAMQIGSELDAVLDAAMTAAPARPRRRRVRVSR